MLVRLAEIDEMGLRELIVETWLTQAPKRLVKEFLDDATCRARGWSGHTTYIT